MSAKDIKMTAEDYITAWHKWVNEPLPAGTSLEESLAHWLYDFHARMSFDDGWKKGYEQARSESESKLQEAKIEGGGIVE